MRRLTLWAILATLLSTFLAPGRAAAEDGKLTVQIIRAEAIAKHKDDWTNSEQDFFVQHAIDFGPPVYAMKISDSDHPDWSQFNTNFKMVPSKNQRFFDLYFELWDDDGCFSCGDNPPDDFDISPQNGPPPKPAVTYDPNWPNGGFPHVQYDVCTGAMYVKSVLGSPIVPIGSNTVTLDGRNTTSGTPDNWATLMFRVIREPANWLPDDVAIGPVTLVQSVYDPTRAVVDKPASMRVEVESTYPLDISSPLYGEMTDGYTTVSDLRTVTIAPGHNVFFLFDDGGSPPFRPWKPITANSGSVRGFARLDIVESISPNAPIQLMDCANANNIGNATALPLSRTQDPKVVFRRFDYSQDNDFITQQRLQDVFDREEPFRLATWPLASLNSSLTFVPLATPHTNISFEPLSTLLSADKLAFLAGIDKLVLTVRNGWFNDNAFQHQGIGPSTGLSLGPIAPRAVLAEDGFYGVSTHELGHTFSQSQHRCTLTDPGKSFLQSALGLFCMDEYLHGPPEDPPYEARGFDVQGLVYPHGMHTQAVGRWAALACDQDTPLRRDVCAPNFMDAIPADTYKNWIDGVTFDDLFTRLRAGTDPPLLHVTGAIILPQGGGDGVLPPPIVGMLDPFDYQANGIPDLPPAPITPNGEQFSGTGAFRVRVVTPVGVRDYRFNLPLFDAPIPPEMRGYFALAIPFDPSMVALELVVPMDLTALTCQNRYCPGNQITVAGIGRTPLPPGIGNLRAGRDSAPPIAPPQPPIIGPGHEAVVAWNAGDPDSPETRAALLVWRQDPGGPAGEVVPLALDVSGGEYRVPQAWLTDTPGTYFGKVVVTDGINTSVASAGPLFNICNFSNGGVEVCNGVDDDCDAIIDNALPPPSQEVQVVQPPGPPGAALLGWIASPSATSWDVVYGSLEALRSSGGNYTLATLGCLAENTAVPGLEVDPVPPVGGGYFYLLRGNNCAGPGTWNSAMPPQVGSRDAGIAAAPGACQP